MTKLQRLVGVFAGAALCVAIASEATEAHPIGFRPGNIMSDEVMSNKNTMDEAAIQAFLKSRNRCNDSDRAKYDKYTAAIETAMGGELQSLSAALASTQPKLESGKNIKTINGQSLLGEGNIELASDSGQQVFIY